MPKRTAEEKHHEKSAKTEKDSTPSRLRSEEDEKDAEIQFDDDYSDEFESEEVFEVGDEEDDEDDEDSGNKPSEQLDTIGEDEEMTDKPKPKRVPQVFLPSRDSLGENEVMEHDQSTYQMFHSINVSWPCLSFDILPDDLGEERRTFPQSMYLVTGTQADKAKENEITVMKLSSLTRTFKNEDDEDEDDDDDADNDEDPILESRSIPLQTTTNRIRLSPHAKTTGEYLTASLGENGDAYIWDITPYYRAFDVPGTVISKQMKKPLYTVSAHGNVESYALDWNPLVSTGQLLTGDISGRIHLTSRGQSGWSTDKTPFVSGSASIEEIQWSPSEKTVFASGGSDGFINIWDTRAPKRKAAVSVKASASDVNVMSWNNLTQYLLASGHDDGSWSVWDLRHFKGDSHSPVADFNFHKKPITSIEFNPSDDSVIAVASEDNTVTLWDLAVEADDEEVTAQYASGELEGVPSQLLFVHWQKDPKEVHWHKQIPGTLVVTGGDGFSMLKTISI